MALLLLAMLGAATADPKRVLLVHSLGFPPWEEYTKSIRKELGRQYQEPLDIYQASLAAAHVDESAEATFADYLRALLANHQPDLVVSVGAPAVGFFQRHRGQLFPSTTPMVLTGVDQGRIAFAALTANDSVVAGSYDLGGLFEKILRVLPGTSNVAMIEEVLTLLHSDLLRRRILVKARLRAGLPEVVANRVQLQQVILNLVVNVADAMDSVTDRDRVLKVTSEKEKPAGVLIAVEDSGLGVEPKDIERIFEPFYTTKSEGMGMGLSICRSIVESHGGRLIATPGHSCGLTMQISIPASANRGALLVDAAAVE